VARQISLTTLETFEVIECAACGVPFAITKRFNDGRRESKEQFYCPNGHTLSYKESPADLLRRDRDRLAQSIAEKDDEIARERAMRQDAIRSNTALRGRVTKLSKRAAHGTCPCCNRTFQQLARHMAQKHPEFITKDGAA
jgi:hypothetical protein